MAKEKNNKTRMNQQTMGGSFRKIIAKHTVESGQTLSDIALKYYNHATPPYWKQILEYNQGLLKGDEKHVRTGMVLEIPELPEELKD